MRLEAFWYFASLNKNELKELENISIKKNYKKGEILFYTKDEPRFLYFLSRGIVKLYKHDLKGNEVILHHLCAPNLIAEIANFEEIPFPASCAFESDSVIYLIDYQKFKALFFSKSEIMMVFMKSLTKKIKALESFINYSVTADSYTKTAKFLYENKEILQTFKQVQIASFLNIAPETLSRNITKLKQEKIIHKKNGFIEILDQKKLQSAYM